MASMSEADVLKALAKSVGRYIEFETKVRVGQPPNPVYVIKDPGGRAVAQDAAATLPAEFGQAIYDGLVAQRYLERDYSKLGECYVLTAAGLTRALA